MTATESDIAITTLDARNPDVELVKRVANFLYQRRVPGGDCVRLVAQGGMIAISGRFPTRYAKWLCIECCRRVAGVVRVIDNVTIAASVNERRPTAVHLGRGNEDCRRRRSSRSKVCGERMIVPFKAGQVLTIRVIPASKRRRLMAAA
jgi:hypothetical protein